MWTGLAVCTSFQSLASASAAAAELHAAPMRQLQLAPTLDRHPEAAAASRAARDLRTEAWVGRTDARRAPHPHSERRRYARRCGSSGAGALGGAGFAREAWLGREISRRVAWRAGVWGRDGASITAGRRRDGRGGRRWEGFDAGGLIRLFIALH